MNAPSEWAELAATAREAAERARRLAPGLLQEEDRSRLLQYAAEMDFQASELEMKAIAPVDPQPRLQSQPEQQQQKQPKKTSRS